MTTKEQKNKALELLRSLYIDREDRGGLNFNSPYEALVATILSAQCTDQRVNIITQELFKNYNEPEKMIQLSEEELKEKIKSCGLANNKAKNILGATRLIIDNFNSEVPRTKKEIMTLPGVGSKTANVVLANAYGVPGLGVDTHVNRVSLRIGLSSGKTVKKVEEELCELIPEELWIKAHHWLIWHGRDICKARNPNCQDCIIKEVCQYYLNNKNEKDE